MDARTTSVFQKLKKAGPKNNEMAYHHSDVSLKNNFEYNFKNYGF